MGGVVLGGFHQPEMACLQYKNMKKESLVRVLKISRLMEEMYRHAVARPICGVACVGTITFYVLALTRCACLDDEDHLTLGCESVEETPRIIFP